jgi:hypothetical protein
MSESNLQDRAAIHDLFRRFCCALDNGEVEAVVDCFTVGAILKSPVIDISGRDEIWLGLPDRRRSLSNQDVRHQTPVDFHSVYLAGVLASPTF